MVLTILIPELIPLPDGEKITTQNFLLLYNEN